MTLAGCRRWDKRSLAALKPLWDDLTAELPHIVCPATDNEENSVGFLLQRRVVEISDGILALRPYRSRAVEEAARRAVTPGSSRGGGPGGISRRAKRAGGAPRQLPPNRSRRSTGCER
ncbi:DUF6545 domain-containing protein [Streptomyces smyrnaeus]|uniref:DUF6545 domain-containing protein n=1 Tax=Streptomyces smyrnaeus TaxID=1387713 RepID=UPI0033E58D53